MSDHTTTAFHRLAEYFGLSDAYLALAICVIAFGVIFGVVGLGIRLVESTPEPEGSRRKDAA